MYCALDRLISRITRLEDDNPIRMKEEILFNAGIGIAWFDFCYYWSGRSGVG